jgi:hypothetical protein
MKSLLLFLLLFFDGVSLAQPSTITFHNCFRVDCLSLWYSHKKIIDVHATKLATNKQLKEEKIVNGLVGMIVYRIKSSVKRFSFSFITFYVNSWNCFFFSTIVPIDRDSRQNSSLNDHMHLQMCLLIKSL